MPQAIPVGPLVVYLGDEPPGTSDDSATIRARRGYLWVDRTGPRLWVCVDPAESAAVWHQIVDAGDLADIATSGDWSDLSATPTTLAGYGITDAVPDSRTITAGAGLEGGGDLSEDRTLSLSAGTLDSLGRADSAVQPGDLAAIATSGDWADISGTPTTLSGYGITDALARASNLSDLSSAATARSNLGLGSAAVEDASAFDAAGSASTAESNANSYTDAAIGALGSAAHEHVGTQPLELPRNTELGSGAFAPYEPLSLYPIIPAAAHILTPDDSGKIVWSAAHDITLPDSTTPGMGPGWRVWIKNTDGVSSITIDCGGADTIDGGASLSLAAGESVLIVMIADGEFGSL